MGLKNLNKNHIDIWKISYIGDIDTDVYPHRGGVDWFFPIIVDGHLVKIKANSKEEALDLQTKLLEDINAVDSYLPG